MSFAMKENPSLILYILLLLSASYFKQEEHDDDVFLGYSIASKEHKFYNKITEESTHLVFDECIVLSEENPMTLSIKEKIRQKHAIKKKLVKVFLRRQGSSKATQRSYHK